MNQSHRLASITAAIVASALLAVAQTRPPDTAYSGWSEYGGSPDAAQYSSLRQINRSNVKHLKIAWKYSTGDGQKYLFNPLLRHGVLYVMAHDKSYVALDAATGKQLWIHPTGVTSTLITSRGLNYWENRDGSDRRLLFAANNYLQEIDARTGQSIRDFGTGGRVDLREGLGRDPASLSLVQSTNPGRVFENLLILGSATNEEYNSAPGDIRAYNVLSGRLVWSFHTIPHAGEFGYDTWPKDAWKHVGGANAWSGLSLDPKRGVVYVPIASPKYNFYGADRPGANLFGDSLVALDARTGKRLWHFQMVHHDIWDYDNATAPKLLTVKHNGKPVDVIAQVNKEGFVWVFNRDTGQPLWPIAERPVPKSTMPGEQTWPTQPFPTQPPPFARQAFTAKDLSPFIKDSAERSALLAEINGARNEGMFTPPGLQNTVEMPGNNGGANFGGAAIDPTSGMLYVVSKDLPAMLKLQLAPTAKRGPVEGREVFSENCTLCHGTNGQGNPPAIPSLVNIGSRLDRAQVQTVIQHGQGLMPAFSHLSPAESSALLDYLFHPPGGHLAGHAPVAPTTPVDAKTAHYKSGFGFMFASSGLPVISPPWTSLTAYDLNTGVIKWKIPLGEVPELAAQGFTKTGSHFPRVAPVVTAGGLLFAGTRDRKVRALDSATGKELWECQLDTGIEGMPAVYEIDGREYVVFCVAAQPIANIRSNAPIPSSYVAFALPSS